MFFGYTLNPCEHRHEHTLHQPANIRSKSWHPSQILPLVLLRRKFSLRTINKPIISVGKITSDDDPIWLSYILAIATHAQFQISRFETENLRHLNYLQNKKKWNNAPTSGAPVERLLNGVTIILTAKRNILPHNNSHHILVLSINLKLAWATPLKWFSEKKVIFATNSRRALNRFEYQPDCNRYISILYIILIGWINANTNITLICSSGTYKYNI